MSSDRVTLFLLEDRDYLRSSIRITFEDRGIRVLDAKSFSDGWEVLQRAGDEVDVLLLDMHLEGPETGADLGQRTKDVFRDWPPEIIIHSGYDHIAYTQAAFRVGAASYLRKAEFPEPAKLVHYVRALALKRALSPERPGLESVLSWISENTSGEKDSLWGLCSRVIGPELLRCAGLPCVLLLSSRGETRCLGQGVEAPEHSPIYGRIQTELFAAPGPVRPFRFEEGSEPWRSPSGAQSDEAVIRLFESHPTSVFMPLAQDQDIHLGLGLLSSASAGRNPASDTLELATAIHSYLRESLVRHQMRITFVLSQERMKRKILLETAASACLYTGQEIVGLLDEYLGESQLDEGKAPAILGRVRAMGDELLSEAAALQALDTPVHEVAGGARPSAEVDLPSLLRERWSQLSSLARVPAGGLLEVEGLAVAGGNRSNVSSSLFRLLLWLAQRLLEVPPEDRKPVRASCREEGKWVEVVLEDSSPRLPARVRDRLFSPFSASDLSKDPTVPEGRRLGLFLAKAMIETAEGGALLDQTDEMPGDQGHRFVVRLCRAGVEAS